MPASNLRRRLILCMLLNDDTTPNSLSCIAYTDLLSYVPFSD